jgi:acetylornithine deacetylase/succinyl-diaminopimelate desuccinylase-like protein
MSAEFVDGACDTASRTQCWAAKSAIIIFSDRADMTALSMLSDQLKSAVNRGRLLDTATKLIAVPSRTGDAGAVSDCLANLLAADGFTVERVAAGHTTSPAVVVRLSSGQPGRTLQFNGHLDTVHLPFIPPAVEGDKLTGSGASDMKAGTAAAVEALRVLRDTKALTAGSVLFTAHDLHEAPWGFGQQLDQMIRDGLHGDAVLIPEYLNTCLPIIGRGNAVWKLRIARKGPPVHEVMRPTDQCDVIAAGADIIGSINKLDRRLARKSDPQAGPQSCFVGQVHSGEIYNQFPQECRIEGTMRWLPGTSAEKMHAALQKAVQDTMDRHHHATVELDFQLIRGAFHLDPEAPIIAAFQQAHKAVSGKSLKFGAKPFVDDANSFSSLANIPAITHGPQAGGAHTTSEWVLIDDLVRVAHLYALTACLYCQSST